MIGVRHTETCLCGCNLIVGLAGEPYETYPEFDLVYVRFVVPSLTGGPSRTREVAYTLSEAGVQR